MTNEIQLPYQVKPNRIYNLIPVPFILGLIFVFVYFIFIKKEDAEGNSAPVVLFVIFGFLSLTGLFLIYQFIKQFLFPRALFSMDENGMEYTGGGVSTGKILWKEIYEVKEIEIRSTQGRLPSTETVLGVVLKDPEKYRNRKNKLLSGLMKLNDSMYETSILISPATFGKDYEPVVNKMQELITAERRRGPGN